MGMIKAIILIGGPQKGWLQYASDISPRMLCVVSSNTSLFMQALASGLFRFRSLSHYSHSGVSHDTASHRSMQSAPGVQGNHNSRILPANRRIEEVPPVGIKGIRWHCDKVSVLSAMTSHTVCCLSDKKCVARADVSSRIGVCFRLSHLIYTVMCVCTILCT